MDKKKYKPRIVDRMVRQYLNAFGAVCIQGPKWCGKTWTSAFHARSAIYIGNPEGGFQNRRLAELDPALVLEGESPRLIDEWQEVPSLWDAVRFSVDNRGGKGHYILTGSATPKHKGILHSGAGRIGVLDMRPMSLFESGDSSGSVSLEKLCAHQMQPMLTGEVELKKLVSYILRGGWPANIGIPTREAMLVPGAYIRQVLEDDVYRLDGVIRDLSKMNLLLRSLARNENTTATNKTLKNDIHITEEETIDPDTLSAYLDIFKRLFLTDNIPPFSANIRSAVRIKQAEKRHLVDPSLACALLGLTEEKLIGDLTTLGFLFESLCTRDLKIYAESFGGKVYHYQDYRNREIDAVIEMPSGEWCAFEIKLGANRIDEAASNLLALSESIQKEGRAPSVLCVVCGLSNAAYRRPDGVYVVPLTALKP